MTCFPIRATVRVVLLASVLPLFSSGPAFGQRQVSQHPVTVNNHTAETIEVGWSRPGKAWQTLGTIPVGESKQFHVTPGDTIGLRGANSSQVFQTWQPRGAETVNLGRRVQPQPQPQPRPGPQPRPQPQPKEQLDLKAAGTAAIDYLNAVRMNPRSYARELGIDTSVIPKTAALKVDDRLTAAAQRKADHLARNGIQGDPHILNINGRQVGMNKWMRDAGYNLPKHLRNEETNFECIAMSSVNGPDTVVEMMKNLLRHGPHQRPLTGGQQFWKPCTDVGIGLALSRDGRTIYMSVLVGYEEN